MSQHDHFGSGFLWGTLFGGILGGVVGAVVASRVGRDMDGDDSEGLLPSSEEGDRLAPNEADMELARRGLEDKIAQLNTAIDDVRQRLGGGVNGHPQSPEEN